MWLRKLQMWGCSECDISRVNASDLTGKNGVLSYFHSPFSISKSVSSKCQVGHKEQLSSLEEERAFFQPRVHDDPRTTPGTPKQASRKLLDSGNWDSVISLSDTYYTHTRDPEDVFKNALYNTIHRSPRRETAQIYVVFIPWDTMQKSTWQGHG